jgi:hypothetical protein
MAIDPVTLMTIAQGLGGALQTGLGAIQRGKAEREATNIIKGMKPDEGILGLYNEGLQRYGISPRESALYKSQMKNINRALATGIGSLQRGGSKSILGGTSSAVRSAADASLAPEIAAEQLKERRFGALLPLAQLRANEIRRPQEMNLQRLLQKAAGGTQIANTGMSNIFGALQSAATQDIYGKVYGGEDYRKNLAQSQANRIEIIKARQAARQARQPKG